MTTFTATGNGIEFARETFNSCYMAHARMSQFLGSVTDNGYILESHTKTRLVLRNGNKVIELAVK